LRRLVFRYLLAVVAIMTLGGCGSEPPPVDDEPVRVRASVESAEVRPGRPFILTVEIDTRDDVTFELPDPGSVIERLVVMKETRDPIETVGNRRLERRRYKLKAPISGTYLIPGVEAPWKTEDLQVGTAGTGPILIEAARAAGEEGSGQEEMRDLKALAPPDRRVWPWLVAAVLLAALAGLVVWLLGRRATVLAAAPPLPKPHERALRDLGRLRHSDLLRAEDQGPFAYEVSAILRRYLEGRYGFRAWRMTTPEILRGMPTELASRRPIELAVRAVLEASDFVKFAGQPVPVEQLEAWVSRAIEVVQATRPRSETEDAA